jgi:hypothetical protein
MDGGFFKLRSPRVMVAAATVLLLHFAVCRYMHPPPTESAPYLAAIMEIKNVLKPPSGAFYRTVKSN